MNDLDTDLVFVFSLFTSILIILHVAKYYVDKWQERELRKYYIYLKRQRLKRERAEKSKDSFGDSTLSQ